MRDFIDKILKRFTELQPDQRGKRIYGAVGYLKITAGAQAFAHDSGLLVIRSTYHNKELVPLPKNFKLRNYHP